MQYVFVVDRLFLPLMTPFPCNILPYASCVHKHIQPRDPRVYFQSTYFSPVRIYPMVVLIDPVHTRFIPSRTPEMRKEMAPSR